MRTICLALLLFGTTYLSHTSVSGLQIRLKPEDGAFTLRSTSKSTSKEFDSPSADFKRIGRHLIVEFMECQFCEEDLDYKILLWYAAYKSGAEVLQVETHSFSPQGWTGFALLAESHISVHTWPEHGYVAIDIFTCGESMDMRKTLAFLIGVFRPGRLHYVGVDRGYTS